NQRPLPFFFFLWSFAVIGGKAGEGDKEENDVYGSSSIGRAAVAKTAGWGFESLLPCATVPNGPANNMFRKVKAFLSEVKVELMKASWPWEPKEKGMKKYKELIDSTLLV